MNAATMVDLRAAEQDWTCSLLYCLCVCVWCVCVWACMFGLAGCFRVPPKASAGEARGLGGGPPSLSCQEGQRIVLHSRQATSLRQEAIVVILRRKARLAFLSRQPLFGKNYKSRRRWKSSRVHGDSSLLLGSWPDHDKRDGRGGSEPASPGL